MVNYLGVAFEDYYSLLEISEAASAQQIRKAYRRQVLKYHPDRNPDDPVAEEQFKKIADAYAVLSDPLSRAEYDQRWRIFSESAARSRTESPREAPRRPRPKPKPRPRPRARPSEPRMQGDFHAQENELEQKDFLQGIVIGTSCTVLFGSLVLKPDPDRSLGVVLLWSLAPLLGAPLGYRIALGVARVLDSFFDRAFSPFPLLESGLRLLPILGATGGACGLVILSGYFEVSLFAAGMMPASLAAGVGAAVGSAFGRAFTSVAQRLAAKLAGAGIGAVVGALLGGLIGVALGALRFGPLLGATIYEALANAGVGGALGGAIASALGSFRASIRSH